MTHFILYQIKYYDDDTYKHRNVIWLRLNQKSFYHYRKWQLLPTDWYRFRTIEKFIESISDDQVPDRYLDALPYYEHSYI